MSEAYTSPTGRFFPTKMILPALFFLFCLTASNANTGVCPEQCMCYGGFVSCNQFTEDVLTKLPASAETLLLNGGNIKSFPPGFLQNLKKLTFLEIQSSRVETVLDGTFAGLSGLDQMALVTCIIGSIESGAFKDMDSVSKLFVSESQIGTIQTGAFSRLNNVGQFSLWSSTVGTVEPWAFSELSDFQSFSFYMNNVTVLSNDAFVSVTNFGTVDVYMNRFTSLIQGGSGMGALKDASTDINLYSNVFVCGCDFVKDFQQPLLSRFVNSQKCVLPELGGSATKGAAASAASLVKLSEVDVNEVCADTTPAQTTRSPSTTSHRTSTFRSTSSANSNLSRSSTTDSDVATTERLRWTTQSRDSSKGELSGDDGGEGGSANSGAGVSRVFMVATLVLLQVSLVPFLTAFLVPTTRPIASIIS